MPWNWCCNSSKQIYNFKCSTFPSSRNSKIYNPQELDESPEFLGWIDNKNFLFKVKQKEFIYNLTTSKYSDQNKTVDTSNWKTYTGTHFAIKYPLSWYVYDFKDQYFNIGLSDVQNITDIPSKIPTENHIVIHIGFYPGTLPSTIIYTNGGALSKTTQFYTLNGLKGIRGKTSTIVDSNNGGEEVDLQNPKGGYATLTLYTASATNTDFFNQILQTFKFTN